MLLENRNTNKKIHEIKEKKHITLMMIPDPTKSAKVIKIPKLPILIGLMVFVLSIISTTGYIVHLRSQVTSTKANEFTASLEIINKDALIEELQATNNEQYQQLQELQTLAINLDDKLKVLETYKDEMDTKLNGTNAQNVKIEEMTIKDSKGIQSVPLGAIKEMSTELVPKEVFKDELNKLTNNLQSSLSSADKNVVAYEQLNTRLDELIPVWEARPTGLPLSSIVVNGEYGWRDDPINGKSDYHTGIDLQAKYVPVYATGSGTVESSEYESGYGYTVVIDHGYGYKTLYAHNSKLLVEEGDIVTKGSQIAVSGASGRVTGAHLHYEVLYHGVTENPRDYLF